APNRAKMRVRAFREEADLIRYRLRPADPARHLFEIDCRIDEPREVERFTMPSWIPGSYLLREFARHVVAVAAESGGHAVPVAKVAHATWECRGATGELSVRITVHAHDLSVRGAFLDRSRAYFNGPCVFLLPEGRDAEAVELTLEPPTHDAGADWRVAT